ALDVAIKQGKISEQIYRDLAGRSRGRADGKSPFDFTMILFDRAEKLNRTHAFIAGYEMAAKKGANFEERVAAGERLVDDSQFIYSKSNRPEIARGMKAPLFTFRLFAGNWIRALRDQNPKTAAGMLGTMAVLGGASSMP